MFHFDIHLTFSFLHVLWVLHHLPEKNLLRFCWQLVPFLSPSTLKRAAEERLAHRLSRLCHWGSHLPSPEGCCFHWPQTRSAHLSTRAVLTDGETALSRRDCPSSCAAAFGTEKQRNQLTSHAPAKTQCCALRCFFLSLFFFASEALHSSV